MKTKTLYLAVLFLAFSVQNAQAAFETRSDALEERRVLDAAELQREIDRTKALENSYEELQKANVLNLELNKKIDVLIENSTKNNQLLETLLQRTE
jgi:hypothetical protein